MTLMNKLLKNVDGDVYRKFRAYCISEGITMGQALSVLMTGVLKGKLSVKASAESAIRGQAKSGSWTWKGCADDDS